MTDTTFVDQQTIIQAAWCNDINDHVYNNTPISPATTVHPSTVIQYNQSGAGATNRTVSSKLQEFVSVKDFGATGDGITDDSVAIAAALATGKAVYFPLGTYITGAQTISTQGQRVFGDGVQSVITSKTANINLFTVTTSYVQIESLRLNGAETNATNSIFAIFTSSATPATYLKVSNILFSGATSSLGFNSGVKLDDSCSFGQVTDCSFERLWGNVSGRGYCILVGNAEGIKVSRNTMIGSSGRGRHGVYISAGASECEVENNYIKSFDQEGISQFSTGVQPSCTNNVYNANTLVGCSASNNTASGSIGIYGHSNNIIISNNNITNSGQRGITVDGSTVTDCVSAIIIGNTVNLSGTNGINVTSVNKCLIAENTIFESSQNLSGASAQIMLRTDGTTATSNVLVTGNICTGNTNARSALGIDPGPPAPTSIRVMANKFNPGNTATIELNGINNIEIDGRIQFRQDSVSYGPITSGSFVTATYTISGADTGDVVTISHQNMVAGCLAFATCNGTNSVVVTVANFTGAPVTIASGSLRIDVWKRVFL